MREIRTERSARAGRERARGRCGIYKSGDADMESFKELVRGVKKPLHMDFNVRDLLLENVKRVYTGETDSKSAAADAAQKLKLYMAED